MIVDKTERLGEDFSAWLRVVIVAEVETPSGRIALVRPSCWPETEAAIPVPVAAAKPAARD